MRADDADRHARICLAELAEPNDPRLCRLVADLGPPAALERALAGQAGERYVARADALDLDGVLARAERLGARYVVPGDLEWPRQLDDLDLPAGDGQGACAPPLGLWVRGTADLRQGLVRSAAVVGSRACTGYGSRGAAELGAGLADRGWATVSGAAYGIDSAAHRGALAAGGLTVAVLACGVDLAYPRGHQGLLDRIGAEGLVVAELPLGAHPTRGRFLDRNRLIAALTPGTVVVEAAYRSGAVNTTTWARRLGRHVLGVPGPVDSPLSAGVHREIRERGAVLVQGAGDVLTELGSLGEALAQAERDLASHLSTARAAARPHDHLTPTAARVLDALGLGSQPAARATLADLARSGFAVRQADRWRATRPPTPDGLDASR